MFRRSTIRAGELSVLYVIDGLGVGGTQRQLLAIVRTSLPPGRAVEICLWNRRETEDCLVDPAELGVPVHLLTANGNVGKLLELRRLILHGRPNIVHSLSSYLNAPVYAASLGTPARPFGSIRTDFVADLTELGRIKSVLNTALPRDQIYNSNAAKRNAETHRSTRLSRIRVIHNAVDLRQFVPSDLPRGVRTIVGIGSLKPVKRWDRLLDATRLLRDDALEFQVVIAGEGPCRESLTRQIGLLGLSECASLPGHVKDIGALLASALLVVHTSSHEGAPNAVFEAMAAARPVVAMDAGDIANIVTDNETGLVVGQDDIGALAAAIRRLLVDRDLAGAMGVAGRVSVETRFDAGRLADDYFDVYESALRPSS
jgi:glycosyltransferase involved in cell wall biosynthesis